MPRYSYNNIIILTTGIMLEFLSARYTSCRYATILSSARVRTLE